MSKRDNHLYEFGPFRLDPAQHMLLREKENVRLWPKVFDLLLFLVQRRGELVKKEEIIKHLWPDTIVEEGNLTNYISIIRKELGDTGKDPKYIETVPKHGYRFVAEVNVMRAEGAHGAGAALPAMCEERARAEGVVEEEVNVKAIPLAGRHTTRRFKAAASALVVITVIAAAYYWRSRTPTPAAPATASSITSIAVLPFKPLEVKDSNPSLEIGMADSMIVKLSKVGHINVLPLSVVRRYTAPGPDAVQVGRELGVEAVLEGNIQKSQDRIRVRVSLVRVRDGKSLWADQFDEQHTDILTVQDAISERVASALELKLGSNETRQLKRHDTENTDAYQAYLRGRYFLNKRGAENLKKAVEEFNQAIALDDKYALAFAGLADCLHLLPSYGGLSPTEGYPKARAAAVRALEIDDAIAEAHAAMGRIKANYDWDWPGAEAEFKRALELNPNYWGAHYYYALSYLVPMGKLDEAAAELLRARELDPFLLIINTNLGVIFYYQGRYDQAIEQYRQALELEPKFVSARLRLIDVYTQTGRYEEALAEHELIVNPSGTENPRFLNPLKEALRKSGPRGYLRKRLDQAKQRVAEKKEYVPATSVAGFAARLGDKELAFKWLETAYEEHDEGLTKLKLDPRYKNLRADPRYADLLRRINLGP
jgi:DNA-binding winged helix-turn-helix (wHTH) protein/TolB-like protein/thioredoxin-like negative regulator of GroEL